MGDQRQKILHVIGNMNPNSGGAQKVIDGLRYRGNQGDKFEHFVFAALQKPPGYEGVINAGMARYELSWRLSPRLIRLCREHGIDLIHIHSAVVGPWARRAARGLGLPTVTTIHTYPSTYKSIVWALEKYSLQNEDHIVCVSHSIQHELYSKFPKLKCKTRVIHNSINTDKFAKVRERRAANLDAGICPGRGNSVLVVGRLHWLKGFDTAIRACAHLKRRGHDLSLDIVGEGTERQKLETLTQTLGLADRVVFHGSINDISPYLADCTVAVIPSRWEGFGLVFLESAIAGVPMVASRLEPFQEIYPEFCHFVDPDDPNAMAEEIAWILSRLKKANRKAQQAGQKLEERFSDSRMTNAYHDLYERVLRVD